MGQYQQWLLYREIDQKLRAQLEELETELTQLQDHARFLEQAGPHTDNEIIRALAASIERDALAIEDRHTIVGPDMAKGELKQRISLAALDGSGLPNFGPQEMREPFYGETESELPATSHSELVLLPENVMDVLNEYGQTEPQFELPWWFHNIAISTDRTSPVDQQTIRTNRLIERWIERWGRQPAPPIQQLPGEDRPA
jgi:hypothetical protein